MLPFCFVRSVSAGQQYRWDEEELEMQHRPLSDADVLRDAHFERMMNPRPLIAFRCDETVPDGRADFFAALHQQLNEQEKLRLARWDNGNYDDVM